MGRIAILKICFFLVCHWCFAQANFHTYTLNGVIRLNSGVVRLIPINSKGFYLNNKEAAESIISNGKFKLKSKIPYPYAYRIGVYQNSIPVYISGIFFLDSGNQMIFCDINSSWKTSDIRNLQMSEYINDFNPLFYLVNQKLAYIDKYRDSLNTIYNNNIPYEYLQLIRNLKSDAENAENEILLNYIKNYNTSFVAFWSFANKVSDSYESIYDTIFNAFSSSLQKNHTGKILNETITLQKQISIGQTFPVMSLLNREFKQTVLPKNNEFKFTLIDFWFSHCNPCISQFGELNQLFKEYNFKGFDIIGVSIDSKKNIPEWKNVIRKHSLSWGQFLDLNGKVANRLGINKYPANFLLNEKGEIVAKDIEPFELSVFLKTHL